MSAGDFNPVDPPVPEDVNPVTAYKRAPAGLSTLATAQFLIATLLLLNAVLIDHRAPLSSSHWTIALYPVALLYAAGLGLGLRQGWGWWLTCAIYAFAALSLPSIVLQSRAADQPFPLGSLIVLALCLVTVGYLNRAEVMRFFRFWTRDGRPGPLLRYSPFAVGGIAALIATSLHLAGN